MKIRNALERHKRSTYQFNTDPISRTHQSEAPACDINQIMAKFQKTGILEHRNTFEGKYGDFIDAPADYHEAANIVLAADEMFSSLPSTIHSRFGNDPAAFVDFVANPKNQKELIALGLAYGPEEDEEVIETPPPQTTPEANPAASGSLPNPPQK